MPIHLFERNSAKKRFRPVRKLNGPDLTDAPLDFKLCNAKHPIVMLATIRCKYPDITELLKLQALDEIKRQR